MKTPQEVFEEFSQRRKAILRALTVDVDVFYELCDPERENLCLYGNPNGEWAVDLPAEEVPPETPEPALGINFARDGMQKRDWLALVAVHSDSWLLALAFYKGARLNKTQRDELFELINSMPTCYEIVSGKAKNNAPPVKKRPPQDRPSGPATGKPPTKSSRPRKPPSSETEDDAAEEEDDDDGWQDGEGDPCPQCSARYRTDEFWIACDYCDTWYCGRCAKMTQAKAKQVKQWKCPTCLEAGH